MEYDELELKKKRQAAMYFWYYVYSQMIAENEKKMIESSKESFDKLLQVFSNAIKPETKTMEKVQKAAVMITVSGKVHEEIATIEKERLAVREKLEKLESAPMEDRAETIKNGIIEHCSKFTSLRDKKALATVGFTILEYLDAMNKDPELAAKVNLTDKQMNVAAKIITMAGIIEEGMKSMEQEMVNASLPEPFLTPEQHMMNLTKIACMDNINDLRLNGTLLKELQECKLIKEKSGENSFELGAIIADEDKRRAMSKSIIDSVSKPQKDKEPPVPSPRK